MNLEDFIQETLVQIINGVKKAETKLNPKLDGRFFGLNFDPKNGGIDFQVVVSTATEVKDGKKVKGSIKVVEGSANRINSDKLEKVNLIKFRVDFGGRSSHL